MHHTGSLCVPSRRVVKRVDYQPERHGSVWMSTPVCGDQVVAEPPRLGIGRVTPMILLSSPWWVILVPVLVPVVDWHLVCDADDRTTAVDCSVRSIFRVKASSLVLGSLTSAIVRLDLSPLYIFVFPSCNR